LIRGILLRRHKRFLADICLEDGSKITAHCANTGAMTGLALPGTPVALSRSIHPGRKYPHSWELSWSGGPSGEGGWVGINTARANTLVAEALAREAIPELAGHSEWRREVPVDLSSGGRLDFRSQTPHHPACWLEVKSVTLRQDGQARFPDAVTLRGRRHVESLRHLVARGERGVLLFLVQRSDCAAFGPAADIDPDYAKALRVAVAMGVEILVYACRVDIRALCLAHRMPLESLNS
jgi:sugar fermentation stimulation protein A